MTSSLFFRVQPVYWLTSTICLLLVSLSISKIQAQTFTDVSSQFPDLPGIASGTVAWIDYNNDNQLDLFIAGSYKTRLYRNTGSGFVNMLAITDKMIQVDSSAATWGDYDNDGRIDLLLTGLTRSGAVSKLYHNLGDRFEDKSGLLPDLPQVRNGAVSWGDYDNDGRLDLILTGIMVGVTRPAEPVTRLYNNTVRGFEDRSSLLPNLPQLGYSAVLWADFDNDNYLDLMAVGMGAVINPQSGRLGKPEAVSKLYRNLGLTKGFDDQGFATMLLGSPIPTNFPPLAQGALAAGDYDADGQLDLIAAGYAPDQRKKTINLYHRDGNFQKDSDHLVRTFIDLHHLSTVPALVNPSLAWGDFDNDGKSDLLITGQSDAGPTSRLYKNINQGIIITATNQLNQFEDQSALIPNLPQVHYGAAAWGDYDHDGRLDLVISGSPAISSTSGQTKVYRNQTAVLNTPPYSFSSVTRVAYDVVHLSQLPTSSVASLDGRTMNLSWYAATDAQLPSSRGQELSYNLSVIDATNGDYLKRPTSDERSGFLRTAQPGVIRPPARPLSGGFIGELPVSQVDYPFAIPDLNPGQTYYWSPQAIDGGLASSPFDRASTFTTPLFRTENVVTNADGSLTLPTAQLKDATMVWGDYNNDGRLDLLLMGSESNSSQITLYQNTPSGFVDKSTLLPAFPLRANEWRRGVAAWADFDQDGLLDLILAVQYNDFQDYSKSGTVTKLYRNTGNGFVEKHLPNTIQEFRDEQIAWVMGSSAAIDYDADGKKDLFFNGRLFRNTGTELVYRGRLPALANTDYNSLAWGDYNNDGKIDFMHTGLDRTTGNPVAKLYRNTGGTFTEAVGLIPNLPQLYGGSIAWGDYDNDGKLDLAITGSEDPYKTAKNVYFNLYQNTANGFSDRSALLPDKPGLTKETIILNKYPFIPVGQVAWVDFDNDGDLDLVGTGFSKLSIIEVRPGGKVTLSKIMNRLYVNQKRPNWTRKPSDRDSLFVDRSDLLSNMIDVGSSIINWIDYDNDGLLDITFASGINNDDYISRIYQNRLRKPSKSTISGLKATPNLICGTGPVTFTAVIGMAASIYSYTLDNGQQSSSGSSSNPNVNATISPRDVGVHSFTLTITDVYGTVNAVTSVTVGALPSISITASPSLTIAAGTTTTLQATGPSSRYQWSTNAEGPSINVSLAATYSVTGVTSIGCTSTTSVTVSVLPVGPSCGNYLTRTTANGLGSNTINGVVSAGNTVYVATNGGLSIATDGGTTFTNRTTNNGLGSNTVNGVFVAGSVLYAATNGGLSISTSGGSRFVNDPIGQRLLNNAVYGVYVKGDSLYVATQNGLGISTDGGNSYTLTPLTGGSDSRVNGVYMANRVLYAATSTGLGISSDGGDSFSFRTTGNGLGSNQINAVYAANNRVYVATSAGLSIAIDGSTVFLTRTTANGLPGNSVSSVYAVGSTVYAATEAGLGISTDGGNTFVAYKSTDGLGNNRINGVFSINDRIYAATDGGLSFCPPVAPKLTNFAASVNPVCAGQPVRFSATAGNVSGSYAYTLTNGSNPLSGTATNASYSQTLTATASGVSTYSLIIQTTAGVASALVSLTVNPLPTVVIFPNGGKLNPTYPQLTLTAVASCSLLQWSTGATSTSITVNTTGVYALTAVDNNGCSAVASVIVTRQGTNLNEVYTIKAGSWDDPATWSVNRLPTIEDAVQLRHSIILPANFQAQAGKIQYTTGGRLVSGAGSRLKIEPYLE